MKKLLGVVPPDDRMGCLQDIHWATGYFGYFPSYSIGNLYSAQLFAAFRAALTERTQESLPLQWATTQNNLGAALMILGERESGRDQSIRRLEAAVAAYRAALTEWTTERVQRWHDMAQQNLAWCLALLERRRNS